VEIILAYSTFFDRSKAPAAIIRSALFERLSFFHDWKVFEAISIFRVTAFSSSC
jgi:hypothetical protein